MTPTRKQFEKAPKPEPEDETNCRCGRSRGITWSKQNGMKYWCSKAPVGCGKETHECDCDHV